MFSDGTTQGVKCIALEPPEKTKEAKWTNTIPGYLKSPLELDLSDPEILKNISDDDWSIHPITHHMAPEIFISDGPPDSIVGKWVAERGGIGGVHHFAYQVEDVQAVMDKWKEKGYAEFLSDKPLECPGLVQVFTKPSQLTGVIYEFIKREAHGFCAENVGGLMESTEECS